MATAVSEREPVAAAEHERPVIAEAAALFDRLDADRLGRRPRLVGPTGTAIELPESVFRLLRQVVHHLARGDSIALVPRHKELTTQQAADLLNVSRPHLVQMLERGEIPFAKTGSHRRVRLGDVLAYGRTRDADRREALDRLTRMSQELGLYNEAVEATPVEALSGDAAGGSD